MYKVHIYAYADKTDSYEDVFLRKYQNRSKVDQKAKRQIDC